MNYKGKLGEEIATRYLIEKKYSILKRNFRTRFGEIDIFAQKNKSIHVIEVKFQSSPVIESIFKINKKKRRRMVLNAQIFMLRCKRLDFFYQFDLITVYGNQVSHVPAMFNLSDI